VGRILLSGPDVGPAERAALLDAFDSGWIAPVGPHLAAFERDVADFIGWPGAVGLSSGTAALHLALLETGVRPDDEVMTSTFTFAATANAVTYCGARPVFIDSECESWNMNPVLLDEALSASRSRGARVGAVVMVDLYGQCADADAIAAVCAAHDVPLIEDAAEALGATYKGRSAGTLGAIGVLSFNGNKIITTSGGGMLVSPSTEVADHARYLSTQARQPTVHYEHHDVGYNYRLSNLLAALGSAQLGRLPGMIERRRAINGRYRAALPELDFMPVPEWSGWNGWLTCVTFADQATRDDAYSRLGAADIESRPPWKPMHLQPVFADCGAFVDGTSEDLFRRGLCLPSGSALSDDDVERVIAVLLA